MTQTVKAPRTTEPDAIAFVDEDAVEGTPGARQGTERSWKILVVDDDQDVHDVSRYVLGNQRLAGRPIELIDARSVKEAQDQLLNHDDVAVILLDVVMEEHDSGLRFARWVREAGLLDVRIILRTGEPGYAPELDVIRDFDINDYRSKSELTRTRLITSVTTALRSFQQLQTAERTARGLETIIASCGQLYQQKDLTRFAELALVQAASLCGSLGEGLIASAGDPNWPGEVRVIAGTGEYAEYAGRGLAEMPEDRPLKAATLHAGATYGVGEGVLALCIDTASGTRFVISLAVDDTLDSLDLALVRLFAANLAAGFEAAGGRSWG